MQVLVIDDEQAVCDMISRILREEGFDTVSANDGATALEVARERDIDLVFSDVHMGGMSGLEVLRAMKEDLHLDAEVILMTGYGSLDAALEAVSHGARDYILKPFTTDDLVSIARSTAERRMRSRAADLTAGEEVTSLIGRSQAMIEVFKTVGRVARTDLPVLICGESGTGKEVIARTIHARSDRASRPFAAINCGALTESLLDSELFGHTRGSFTGAMADHRGLFEQANGGTLLLDEVTETSPAFQVKLLRALQEGEVRRVGSSLSTRVDVRVIATTNRDPESLVATGHFRQDLLYRLNAVTISVPPLRGRADDVELMVFSFIRQFQSPAGPAVQITEEAVEALKRYHWPGNVRELRHTIQRLVALVPDNVITIEDLPVAIRTASGELEEVFDVAELSASTSGDRRWPSLEEVEARYLARVLGHTGGNARRAAGILGVDRKTLSRMVQRSGIDIDRIRRVSKH
jgi:DNA-binding NtrC family response regulator